jgi:hypothetical protein
VGDDRERSWANGDPDTGSLSLSPFTPGRRRLTALCLAAQRIGGGESAAPAEAIRSMLAMQIQDFPGVKWSVASAWPARQRPPSRRLATPARSSALGPCAAPPTSLRAKVSAGCSGSRRPGRSPRPPVGGPRSGSRRPIWSAPARSPKPPWRALGPGPRGHPGDVSCGRCQHPRPARLFAALVPRPDRHTRTLPVRRPATDLRAPRRMGAEYTPDGARRGAGHARAVLLPDRLSSSARPCSCPRDVEEVAWAMHAELCHWKFHTTVYLNSWRVRAATILAEAREVPL